MRITHGQNTAIFDNIRSTYPKNTSIGSTCGIGSRKSWEYRQCLEYRTPNYCEYTQYELHGKLKYCQYLPCVPPVCCPSSFSSSLCSTLLGASVQHCSAVIPALRLYDDTWYRQLVIVPAVFCVVVLSTVDKKSSCLSSRMEEDQNWHGHIQE